jgi:hypothetical protein
MNFTKTRFAPDPNAKPPVKRPKPVDQPCLGILADGTPCGKRLPYNPAARLCSNCRKRNADQGRLIANQGGGSQHVKRSSSQIKAT